MPEILIVIGGSTTNLGPAEGKDATETVEEQYNQRDDETDLNTEGEVDTIGLGPDNEPTRGGASQFNSSETVVSEITMLPPVETFEFRERNGGNNGAGGGHDVSAVAPLSGVAPTIILCSPPRSLAISSELPLATPVRQQPEVPIYEATLFVPEIRAHAADSEGGPSTSTEAHLKWYQKPSVI